MQIALQDIRKWGNLKIYNCFLRANESFYNVMVQVDNLRSDINITPYSIPRKWGTMIENFPEEYKGFKEYVYFCEPMLDNITPDDICKRKFRNIWEKIWNNFAKDVNLTEPQKNFFSSFGIRLVFILKDSSNFSSYYAKILELFNAVLIWSLYTSQEANFTSDSLSYIKLIENMILFDDRFFVKYIIDCLSV